MGSRIRALVVEDDDATREMLCQALNDAGFDAVAALDGMHALRTSLAKRPQVILLDLGMPNLDGSGYLKQWRERDPGARKVPVIVMSGLGYGEQIAEQVGGVKFLSKPFDIDEAIAALEAHGKAWRGGVTKERHDSGVDLQGAPCSCLV